MSLLLHFCGSVLNSIESNDFGAFSNFCESCDPCACCNCLLWLLQFCQISLISVYWRILIISNILATLMICSVSVISGIHDSDAFCYMISRISCFCIFQIVFRFQVFPWFLWFLPPLHLFCDFLWFMYLFDLFDFCDSLRCLDFPLLSEIFVNQ